MSISLVKISSQTQVSSSQLCALFDINRFTMDVWAWLQSTTYPPLLHCSLKSSSCQAHLLASHDCKPGELRRGLENTTLNQLGNHETVINVQECFWLIYGLTLKQENWKVIQCQCWIAKIERSGLKLEFGICHICPKHWGYLTQALVPLEPSCQQLHLPPSRWRTYLMSSLQVK